MVPLTWQMVVDAAAEYLGASKAEVMGAIKQSLHPRELRDEFAMAALTGFAAHSIGATKRNGETGAQANARLAYEYADAMMEARNANR